MNLYNSTRLPGWEFRFHLDEVERFFRIYICLTSITFYILHTFSYLDNKIAILCLGVISISLSLHSFHTFRSHIFYSLDFCQLSVLDPGRAPVWVCKVWSSMHSYDWLTCFFHNICLRSLLLWETGHARKFWATVLVSTLWSRRKIGSFFSQYFCENVWHTDSLRNCIASINI